MRSRLRNLALTLARALGSEFYDVETGRPLGKALIFGWRGKVHVIGLDPVVRPRFLSQERVTYLKQEIGFSRYPQPDFPSLRKHSSSNDSGVAQ